MRRADRLFQLVGILGRKRTRTAQQLADELEVSVRTVYRDVLDLVASGVPILGEAGVGYRLDPGYRLPPMTFTPDEVEALTLGMRMVETWGDPDLRNAARSVLDKVASVASPLSQTRLSATALFSLNIRSPEAATPYLKESRHAINAREKLHLCYQDAAQEASERTVRPLGLFFWGRSWTLAAWCELRNNFRNFRVDRIAELRLLNEQFELISPCTLSDYIHAMNNEPRGDAPADPKGLVAKSLQAPQASRQTPTLKR